MKILGQLRCDACARERGNWINLGTVDGEDVKVSGVLQDVIGHDPNKLYRLRCGHFSSGFPVAAQEFITLPDGTTVRGPGLENITNDARAEIGGGL